MGACKNYIEWKLSMCKQRRLTAKEAYWIRELKASLNSCIPFRTDKEYREDNKEFKAQYYIDNKETINERKKNYYQDNKEALCEKARKWVENNKERKKDMDRECREKNKIKISERSKEIFQCEVCGVNIPILINLYMIKPKYRCFKWCWT